MYNVRREGVLGSGSPRALWRFARSGRTGPAGHHRAPRRAIHVAKRVHNAASFGEAVFRVAGSGCRQWPMDLDALENRGQVPSSRRTTKDPVILLDTNAVIWITRNHRRTRTLARTPRLYVSPATLLEVQM